MKKLSQYSFLALALLVVSEASAISYQTHLQGSATKCFQINLWSGACANGECTYPDEETAIADLLEQTEQSPHFYGCTQLSKYKVSYRDHMEKSGMLCKTTEVSALFECEAAW